MMEPLRILMVHNYYQIGGGEHTVFENEVKLLRERGNTVFTYTKDNAVLKKSKLRLICMPFTTVWSFSSYREVMRLIREENIQVVHCHNTFPLISPSVYYAAWKCHVPVVQTVHNFRFVCPNAILFRDGKICEECIQCGPMRGIRYGCYRGSRIQTAVVSVMLQIHRMMGTYRRLNYIFLTEFNRNKIVPVLHPDGKTFVKHNFVLSASEQAVSTTDSNRFVYVGRLDKVKGFGFLMQFFSHHPEWQLYAFGSGDLDAQAKEAEKAHSNLHIMGFQSRETMREIWQSSCALIFASELYEGQPMTIEESFAQGVPVITVALGNQKDMVQAGKTGELFALHDELSLEQAVRTVQKNRAQYMPALSTAAQEYSADRNYEQLMQIYTELICEEKIENA